MLGERFYARDQVVLAESVFDEVWYIHDSLELLSKALITLSVNQFAR